MCKITKYINELYPNTRDKVQFDILVKVDF